MFCTATTIHDLARKLGVSPGQLHGEHASAWKLDLKDVEASRGKLARHVQMLDAKYGGGKMDETRRHDAASAFMTSGLSTILAPVMQVSSRKFLFAPGYTQGGGLLPVQQRVELGKQQLEYPVIAVTGEARRMAHGSTKDLRRVGTVDDYKSQPVALYGVRFGVDEFELWQAAHLGRSPLMEKQRGAGFAMAEYFEETAGNGDSTAKIPGFFNHGSCFSLTLTKTFGDSSITGAEMLLQLAILDLAWSRANGNRVVSGVAMPKVHRLNLLQKFFGDAATPGENAWKFAKEAFPWLNNIVEDDRLLTMNPDGGPMWQLWSADGEDQYLEGSPAPMMFGPFTDELRSDYILVAQTGGCVNKDTRAIFRVYMPA
jgi:hypothetical protein